MKFAQDGTAIMTVKNSDIYNNIAEFGCRICSLRLHKGLVKKPASILNVQDSDIHHNVGAGLCSIAGNSWAMINATATLNVQNSTIHDNMGTSIRLSSFYNNILNGGGIYSSTK